MNTNPLIIQSGLTILMETDGPKSKDAKIALNQFAELVKSPEHIHTYQITPLSVWNAMAAGMPNTYIMETLNQYKKFDFPAVVEKEIQNLTERYGQIVIVKENDVLFIRFLSDFVQTLVLNDKNITPLIGRQSDEHSFQLELIYRGLVKQKLIEFGYPVQDEAGFIEGEPLTLFLKESEETFQLRHYQREAVDLFYAKGSFSAGHGVIVLPCGAGKTLVGIATMAAIKQKTLILTTGNTSVRQWQREILDKTTLEKESVAEYSGKTKTIADVTIATYQMLSYRNQDGEFPHFELFDKGNWGLIIYDEVHLLPAPVFRITASLQAKRRLGLTATLVREDGKEKDVFALIGPKRYDVPWKEMEEQGFIADATCVEVKVKQSDAYNMEYAMAENKHRFRIAAENPRKIEMLKELLARYSDKQILIIGEYITQIEQIAGELDLKIIFGKTKQQEREEIFQQFRNKEIKTLVLSRVGNFAIDLPDADLLIQMSGKYGSRQEEAQRLGRVLRPKKDGHGALFYSLVSSQTCEEEFARNRQIFLTEQGYAYEIEVF